MLIFFYGFVAGFIGYLPPSMINMSIVGISVKNNLKSGMVFSLGALLIGGIQEWFSLSCSDMIVENKGVLEVLTNSAVFVLILLGSVFLYKGIKERKQKEEISNPADEKSNQGFFFRGVFTSMLNFLAIPYWMVVGTVFGAKGWLSFERPELDYFIVGGVIGMMCLFVGYVFLSEILAKRMAHVARNMSFILGVIFLLLGVIQLIRLVL